MRETNRKDSLYLKLLRLYEWVKDQYVTSIRVYKDGIQVFDAEYPEQEVWEENIGISEYGWETYYTVHFADGEAKVHIQGGTPTCFITMP